MTDAPGHSPAGLDGVRVALQYLLPKTLLTALAYRATRVRFRPWKDWVIRWFIARYGVDMLEALDADPGSYEHFNAFFTRALRPGSRPLEGDDESVLCPADGGVSAIGHVGNGMLLQAKGRHYSLHSLLGGDAARAAPFANGHFATVYLSPRDYHRVHMPVDGRLREMTYVPGRLFSVNHATTRRMPDLFARNERLVCVFDTHLGPMALILVGALNVAGMQTVWSGPVTPPHGQPMRTWRYDDANAVKLSRGEEMGRFNMGSTVILLFPTGRVGWRDDLGTGSSVRMGQIIGRILPATGSEQIPGSAAEG
jgi:phosphatidylserine decarboxylase